MSCFVPSSSHVLEWLAMIWNGVECCCELWCPALPSSCALP